jgi:uncharacterized protein YggE
LAAGLLVLAAVGGLRETAAADMGRRWQGQVSPADGERSITTIGYGRAAVPAETVEMQLVLSTQEAYGSPFPRLGPDDTLGEAELTAAEPVVQALVGAGVPEEDVQVLTSPALTAFGGQGGRGVYRLDLSLEGPDLNLDRLNELVNAAGQAAAEEGQILSFVGARFRVADCGPVRQESRQAANEDALTRAEEQAELMGVELGPQLRSVDGTAAAGSSEFAAYAGILPASIGGCDPATDTDVSFGPGTTITVPTFDPTAPAEVEVYTQLTATYAIGPESNATPVG